jgi:thiopeptide-type bacteriocin biosynthesis protein
LKPNSLIPANFFVVRISTLPLANMKNLNDAMMEGEINGIKKYFTETIFLNALYFASRTFYYTALNWLDNKTITFDPSDRVLQSLYKYYSRMCTRCTPYGLFAAFASGKMHQGETNILLQAQHLMVKVRTDVLFLRKLKDIIIAENNEQIPFFQNNTLYSGGDKWRYISWTNKYNYEIAEVPLHNILNAIIDRAKKGITTSEIRNFILTQIPDIEHTEVTEYINSLIESKILVDRLPPYMTSLEDPLSELQKYLLRYGYQSDTLLTIKNIQDNSYDVFASNHIVKEIEKKAHEFTEIIDQNRQIVQIDSIATLSRKHVNQTVTSLLSKRAEDLIPLVKGTVNHRLWNFTNRFNKKFENMEMPLVRALDPDFGVGYDYQISGNLEETPLLEEIFFTFNEADDTESVAPIVKLVLDKYPHCFSPETFTPIILTEQDIKKAGRQQDPPLSFGFNNHIFGSFICKSQKDVDDGNFKFLTVSPIPTPLANIVLSRFAYHDAQLTEDLKSITEKDSGNTIYVELLHHREDRLGNVLQRPNFHNYELPYASESKNDDDSVILINDIYIRFENGKLKLRSKKLNKEIKPKFTNAYNYGENQLPIIKFLGDFQFYGVDLGFKWNWGFLEKNGFLPRVEYKEFILSEACWRIDMDKNMSVKKLNKIIHDKNIPQLCTVKERDNVLVLDTGNETCLHILTRQIIKETIYLYEYFEPLQLPDENGKSFASEFIFPFNSREENMPDNNDFVTQTEITKRKYIPGDEWTFYKIYTSHKYADQIITKVIANYVRSFAQGEDQCPWFFLRFQDPEYHVRFRIKKSINEQGLQYLNKQLSKLVEDDVVSSFEIDTYNREIERYGAEHIELSEQIFHYDSVAVLDFLKTDALTEEMRWKTGVFSLDLLMNDFQISMEDRITLFEQLYQAFMPEHVDHSNPENVQRFKKSIDKKYRDNRDFLDAVLRQKDYEELDNFIDPFIRRSENIRDLSGLIKNTKSDHALLTLLQDYVHMNMNRIFLTKARMHEFVIYFFMYKTYNSIKHRYVEAS